MLRCRTIRDAPARAELRGDPEISGSSQVPGSSVDLLDREWSYPIIAANSAGVHLKCDSEGNFQMLRYNPQTFGGYIHEAYVRPDNDGHRVCISCHRPGAGSWKLRPRMFARIHHAIFKRDDRAQSA